MTLTTLALYQRSSWLFKALCRHAQGQGRRLLEKVETCQTAKDTTNAAIAGSP